MKQKVSALEIAISAERTADLIALPSKFGFDDPASFIAAFKAATGTGRKRLGRKPGTAARTGGNLRAERRDRPWASCKRRPVTKGRIGCRHALDVGAADFRFVPEGWRLGHDVWFLGSLKPAGYRCGVPSTDALQAL